MARLMLIDVMNNEIKEVNIKQSDINMYHELIGCRCFDIASRQIGGKYFDIFCDDEGLLQDPQPPISAYDTERNEPMLVGNLIIANHDMEGNTTSLSDDDIEHIKKHILYARSERFPIGYRLIDCQY